MCFWGISLCDSGGVLQFLGSSMLDCAFKNPIRRKQKAAIDVDIPYVILCYWIGLLAQKYWLQ